MAEAGVDPLWTDWEPPADSIVDVYMLWEASGRQHLPDGGGLLDQDEWLMHQLGILAEKSAVIRAEVRNG
ncbi:MAG: hypothetical protein ACYTEQ_06485 [Planctomycetota bacterium]